MEKLCITCIILANCIVFSVLGDKTEMSAQVDAQAWSAITNKWLSGDEGIFLNKFKEVIREELIVTNLVLNGYLSAIIPNVRIYQVGVLNLKQIKNLKRDKASLVIDGSRLTFVETDDEAVSYLNSNRCKYAFSMVRAVQEVLSFGELRGYTLLTEETLQILKNSTSTQTKISSWSFSVREGKEDNTIEATFLTVYMLESPRIIFSNRFTFKFKRDGMMILDKVEETSSVGGFR